MQPSSFSSIYKSNTCIYSMIIENSDFFIPKSMIQRFYLNSSLTCLHKRETKTKKSVIKRWVTPIIIYDTLFFSLAETVQIQMANFCDLLLL
jgi:hypothetical protein